MHKTNEQQLKFYGHIKSTLVINNNNNNYSNNNVNNRIKTFGQQKYDKILTTKRPVSHINSGDKRQQSWKFQMSI